MKIAIVYFSKTGNTQKMAEVVKTGVEKVEGCQARLFDLNHVDADYIKECSAVIFGTPTYLANTCWQMKKFLDECTLPLGGKIGAVFATANYLQGGADTAILTIINHLMVKGMLVYSGGASLGKPYIHLGAVALRDHLEESCELFELFGTRIAQKAKELFENQK